MIGITAVNGPATSAPAPANSPSDSPADETPELDPTTPSETDIPSGTLKIRLNDNFSPSIDYDILKNTKRKRTSQKLIKLVIYTVLDNTLKFVTVLRIGCLYEYCRYRV